jgi:pimeloyl-ACP methyl ester carboxylesterase
MKNVQAQPVRRALKPLARTIGIALVLYLAVVALVYFRQRALLFFPSHHAGSTDLKPWSDDSARVIGFCREATNARTIWLMMHGNGGQASDRGYVLERMSAADSLYVLEYPGYGLREGKPTLESMNRAASEAYQLLRVRNPGTPVCVLGESIGSGPACALAEQKPDKILLVVPFDTLANVAAKKFFLLPVRLLLRDRWNNVESLKHYTGPVEIYGASDDGIIPMVHAERLAKQVPGAKFTPIGGGHNDWSDSDLVKLER